MYQTSVNSGALVEWLGPVDPSTIFQDVQPKEGKGGEEALPPLPPINAAFLQTVLQGVSDGAYAAVCSKAGDPTAGEWRAERALEVDQQCPSDRNNYFNCSSFMAEEDGSIKARSERFSGYHVVVLDDVGTKVDRAKLSAFKPTWDLLTSPGNSQVGIRLSEPLRDPAVVAKLQAAIVRAGLCDGGAKGLARWARLPSAINGKDKHRDASKAPFQCHLEAWNPDVAYTVSELVQALGLTLDRPVLSVPSKGATGSHSVSVAAVSDGVWTPAPTLNPVLGALQARGLYKGQLAPGKHDVSCPWLSEHTDDIDTGAAYFEPGPDHPRGGFFCFHSHGDQFHIHELLQFLNVDADSARCKARIDIIPGEMNRVRRASERSLALCGGYYQSGGAIVVVRRDPGSGDITTELLGEAPLTAALADAADWHRFDGRSSKAVRCDPPPRHVQTLLKSQQFEYLPVLTGLARQPFFREGSGELVTDRGSDTSSGRYAEFNEAEFARPEPTELAARQALDTLLGLLSEYRFAKEEDRSAALCAMLTATVRPSLVTAPAFNITASTPGSGKSYLAATITPFAGPGAPMKLSYPTSAEEASKAMLSAFLSAPAAIVFDDMQGQWQPFGAINRALTSDTITDRILGVSRNATVGTRSLILGTGNNVGPVRDMTRRVVTITLHHKVATPALERNEGRPAETVAKERGKYVSAALTIIAAYRKAGAPKADVPSIASFGAWSDMCRQPLLWLGLPDPASSILQQLRHDPDQDDLTHLLRAWYDAVGDRPIVLRDLIEKSVGRPDLHDALMELPVVERDGINRSKLGWYLKRNANRIVEGLELQDAHSSTRKGWRVVTVEGCDVPV
jgi:hypothetical protein